MPCYTVQLTSVEFKIENWSLLEAAVKSLGWRIDGNVITSMHGSKKDVRGANITIQDGKATTVATAQQLVNRLKQQYSKEAIKFATSKFGWTNIQKAENKFVAQKGRF